MSMPTPCPACKQPLQVPDNAVINMESYGKSVKARTLCCHTVLQLQPRFSFTAYEMQNPPSQDDWGR